MISIRHANTGDLETMIELLEMLFSIEKDFIIDREAHRAGLLLLLADAARSAVIVAERAGVVAGMVTGQLVVSSAVGGYSLLLEDLVVDETYRAMGIGSALVSSLLVWGKTRGAVRIQLVADRMNETALQFYRHHGFSSSNMTGLYRSINAD